MPDLVLPDVRFQRSFLEAMDEFRAEGVSDSQTASWIDTWSGRWQDPDQFAAFTAQLRAESREETPRPPRFVPSTTWWWVEGEQYLGRIAVRHRLNDFLLEVGGHIGYDIRPGARRRGQATAMLRATLPRAHGLGIDPALITCDADNLPSRRVIEACGGVLEDQRGIKLRFWVPTG